MDGAHFDQEATEALPQLDELQRRNVHPVADVVPWDLGTGETNVLSFAARHRDYVAVLDDMLAKKCAKFLGLPTLGTGSILILAKEQGLIESVGQSLAILQQVGLWVSGAIVQILLKQAG